MPRPVALLIPHAAEFAGARGRALLVAATLALAACAESKVAGPPPETQAAPPPAETAAPPPREPAPVEPEPSVTIATPAPPERTRVALIVPLTGAAASVGRDLVDAAQLALFDFSMPDLELRVYDSGGTENSALAAAEAARADGVRLVLGPLLSEAVAGASGIMRAARIPVFAFSNDRMVAGDGIYVAGFSPEAQVDRVVAFALRRGLLGFAALVPDDEFGARMGTILSDTVARRGGVLVTTAFYPLDTDALTAAVRALARYDERAVALNREKSLLAGRDDAFAQRARERLEARDTLGDAGFEALLLAAGGEEVRQLASLLAFFDVDPAQVKLLGTWLWDDPALGKEPPMLGAWFAAPPPDARRQFVERFRETFSRTPDRLSTLAYDGVALAAVLSKNAGAAATPYTRERLESPAGFAGVDGIFRLTESGAVERGLSVLEMQSDGPREIDPAPTGFAPPVTN